MVERKVYVELSEGYPGRDLANVVNDLQGDEIIVRLKVSFDDKRVFDCGHEYGEGWVLRYEFAVASKRGFGLRNKIVQPTKEWKQLEYAFERCPLAFTKGKTSREVFHDGFSMLLEGILAFTRDTVVEYQRGLEHAVTAIKKVCAVDEAVGYNNEEYARLLQRDLGYDVREVLSHSLCQKDVFEVLRIGCFAEERLQGLKPKQDEFWKMLAGIRYVKEKVVMSVQS
jgi:hypothetical protein